MLQAYPVNPPLSSTLLLPQHLVALAQLQAPQLASICLDRKESNRLPPNNWDSPPPLWYYHADPHSMACLSPAAAALCMRPRPVDAASGRPAGLVLQLSGLPEWVLQSAREVVRYAGRDSWLTVK